MFCWGRKCLCGDRYTRGHERCMGLENVLTEDEEMEMAIDKTLLPLDTKYTIIDYLLNNRHYTRAYDILINWQQKLSQRFVQVAQDQAASHSHGIVSR